MERAFTGLKARQRAERDNYPENLSVRVHRAFSWLDRAEREADRVHRNEHATSEGFRPKMCDLDTEKPVDELIWMAQPNAIRLLPDNSYLFSCFGGCHKRCLTAVLSLAKTTFSTAVLREPVPDGRSRNGTGRKKTALTRCRKQDDDQ